MSVRSSPEQREYLRRRNALWVRLRTLSEASPEFEEVLAELGALTGWDRARLLAGLGLSGERT
ncbi:hypothetical protein SAMN04488058_108120 [Deinococcus reticulitermitis]|uniref:Uncharacterized protein n=1 Tax=Deinococcus reticulitermitis TaxID=856736 RepID=A0A1H6YX73_9DEIO|nr:hypothetical protein [Deinococcus reticulitermitis]SEJ45849.1 hypothetical protein SAMN04488058_108120 [Deinococcus reticulitermitis]